MIKPEQSNPFTGSVDAYRYGMPISFFANDSTSAGFVSAVSIIPAFLYGSTVFLQDSLL